MLFELRKQIENEFRFVANRERATAFQHGWLLNRHPRRQADRGMELADGNGISIGMETEVVTFSVNETSFDSRSSKHG